jgi:YaiO family outer membrane protein
VTLGGGHSRRILRRSSVIARGALGLLAGIVATSSGAEVWRAAIRAGDYGRARTEIENALLAAPEDTSLRYELARVLGLLGSAEAALAEFDALIARYPKNADYLLGRAQMLARLGQDAAALETTEQTLLFAPEYEDVWDLHLRLAERTADGAVTAAIRREIAARFPDASWWQRGTAPAEHTRWISIDWGADRLSSGAPDWSRQSLRLDWQTSGGATFYGDIAHAERFDRTDSSLGIGGVWQAVAQWHVGAGLAVATDAEFEAAREQSLSARRPWGEGWGTELGFRRREYSSATVASYSFTADKYLADYRIAYRLDHSHLLGASSSAGHSVIIGWYPNERRSLGVTLGAGEEIETISLDQLLRTRVSSVTLSGRETLSARFSLSWWLGTHRQGNFYRRRYGGLAVRVGL